MAFAENHGAKIYWDEAGEGTPLLMIMGLAYTAHAWHRSRGVLAARYRTIAFDNRGVGRSEMPPSPCYSIALMASDALAVLDAAGAERAHVFGISMGGMIAQEFALQYPHRVRSLILGCTTARAPESESPRQEATDLLMARGSMAPEEAAQAAVPFIYDAGTARERIDEDIAVRRPWFPRAEAYNSQLMGILGWESYSRLEQICCPTLVIHGESDQLVPASHGRFLAEKIPGAELVVLPHAGHIFATDQPEAAHRAIQEFLQNQDKVRSASEPVA
jgi:3-oxoadipate enol-lactonase